MNDTAWRASIDEDSARRRPILAMTLSLMLPGLGQVYNGEVYKGALLFALLALLPASSAWLAVEVGGRWLFILVILGVALAIAVYLVSVIDAHRVARTRGDGYVLRPYNQAYAYLALFLAGYFFVLTPAVQHTKDAWLELFKIPTSSMLPTLWPGDRLFADKHVNRPGAPRIWRGAVAIFTYPNDRTLTYVKRVIGLPGDLVEIRGTAIVVNGRSIQAEPVTDLGSARRNALLADHVAFREIGDRASYLTLWNKSAAHGESALEVPPGHVFVMGDNRDATQDSRHFGVVPLTDIVGIARQILIAADHEGVEWRRTGEIIP
jgi:signal peptidase I